MFSLRALGLRIVLEFILQSRMEQLATNSQALADD